jgi:hypothetical protein
VLKFAEFDKNFKVYTGASILHWRSFYTSWMAISYESMKLNGCQRRRPTHRHSTSLGDVATLVGVAQDQGVHEQCVLKVFWDRTHVQGSAEPLRWLNTLALMKVDLIHKVGHDNMVWNKLWGRKKFQAMSTIQILVANVCW